MAFWTFSWLGVRYRPRPQEQAFLERAEVQQDDELVVRVAVLDDRESERFFGVPLARRGMQPVWLRITNNSIHPYRLRLASLDPNYYPPLEAAFVNHHSIGRRLLAYGVLAWVFFLPLIVLLPFRILAALRANRRMDAFFQQYGIGVGIIRPGKELAGFAFTSLDRGRKIVPVQLLGAGRVKDFPFAIVVPGLKVDHAGGDFDTLYSPAETVECDDAKLRTHLAGLPRSTGNRRGTAEGDPLNLVVVGTFQTVLDGFGARWDETEAISLRSCWRTFRAFLLGSGYRYSPVSSLFVEGRSQDFALQRIRRSINERLHLRLWMTPLRYRGQPVWIGQISRDIGVRFTLKTWNLTTHKIDPDVDDARDYVLDDLMEAGRVSQVAYALGVGAADRTAPRRNLTGDPYFTDGLRAVAFFSETRTTPTFLEWV